MEVNFVQERLILVTKKLPLFMKLNTYCNDHGWMVYNTMDPEETLDFINHRHVAEIIYDLDAASPEVTLSLIKKIRESFNKPILTLTAKKDFEYEMKLFGLHVDDYIVEPYEYEEIIVRTQQCLWGRTIQTSQQPPELIDQEVDVDDSLIAEYLAPEEHSSHPHHHHNHLQLDDLLLDIDHYRVLKNNEDLGLTPKEFKLLYFLVKNRGQVISREQLLRGVWNYNDDLGTSRIVDIHISHLRDKIEPDPHHPKYIKTVRGFGYTFEGQELKIVKDNK